MSTTKTNITVRPTALTTCWHKIITVTSGARVRTAHMASASLELFPPPWQLANKQYVISKHAAELVKNTWWPKTSLTFRHIVWREKKPVIVGRKVLSSGFLENFWISRFNVWTAFFRTTTWIIEMLLVPPHWLEIWKKRTSQAGSQRQQAS